MKIIFKMSNRGVRNPKHLRKNIFIIYSSKKVKIEPSTCLNIDTEIILSLPEKSNGFVTSIFRDDEVNELRQKKRRLQIEILNKSFEDTIEIKRHSPLGFVVIEPEYLKLKHEMPKNKKEKIHNIKNIVQVEDTKGNVVVFLTAMIWLIKPPSLPLMSSKQQQTISTKLLNKE